MPWPSTTISTVNMDATTDSPATARADIKQMADNVNTMQAARGASDGIASTDSGGKVPVAQLPTIPANQGGTGQSVFNVGDLLFANTTSTLQKLSAGAVSYVLTSNGPGAAPSWQLAGGGLVSGTRLSFQQTTAPTGWTKDTTAALNDSIMRIVTGSAGNGGSNAFSTFNGQTATGSYALTASDIPSHTHNQRVSNTGSTVTLTSSSPGASSHLNSTAGNGSQSGGAILTTAATGGGGAHSHSMMTDIKYRDFIIATKD